ncbi:hypothetical protein HNV11_15305 [Spirosoma taeanense]|uniref:Lipocalin-like domain-containing protein n=1 Tax=Spirosoma taeanense TaxID=2735870 RepID=A0A6M5YBL7_9BACT|nr:hypothetical protein [Spirosoma taeanense]QJW90651.1 hypothetical protein HNV11_15305 [Spirosoma taeanense]
MKPQHFFLLGISLTMAMCRPATPDPADRYVGTWDCQASVTETGVQSARSFKELPIVNISKLDANNVKITFPDSSSLQMNAELVNRKLVIRRQDTYLYATGRYNGRVTVLGDGDFNNTKLTLIYTATAGTQSYTRSVQLAGTKR